MDALIDTNIIIDIYRGFAPAEIWVSANSTRLLGVTIIAWMEAVEGIPGKSAQEKMLKLLGRFPVIYLSQEDMIWDREQLLRFRLSHSVEFSDCLIAAPSHRLGIVTYTRNLKHFTPLLGELALQPY